MVGVNRRELNMDHWEERTKSSPYMGHHKWEHEILREEGPFQGSNVASMGGIVELCGNKSVSSTRGLVFALSSHWPVSFSSLYTLNFDPHFL
jgi:hypothetical protein